MWKRFFIEGAGLATKNSGSRGNKNIVRKAFLLIETNRETRRKEPFENDDWVPHKRLVQFIFTTLVIHDTFY